MTEKNNEEHILASKEIESAPVKPKPARAPRKKAVPAKGSARGTMTLKKEILSKDPFKFEDGTVSPSATRILEAATDLFARGSFDSVSIKDIASASGVNSALISYYFGGKKNLYQEVLVTHAKSFITLQDNIRKLDISPLDKLRNYVETIATLQYKHPYHIHLIFRELLMPNPTFEGFVKNYLYRAHQFMAELVQDAIGKKEIHTEMQPTHVAFTLESMILFFFLMHNQVRMLGNFKPRHEVEYLFTNLESFLDTLRA